MGTVDRPPPTPTCLDPNIRHGNSVGSMSALYANSPNIAPRVRLSLSFLSSAEEKQVVSYLPKEWTLDSSKLPTGLAKEQCG